MAVARSFSDYVKNKCYNGLFDAAKEYFDEYWDGMDLHSSRVRHITTAEIIDATIQRVYVTDRPGDGIAFDVGLELEIAVSAADHHTESDDTCYQWLRISCEGDLAVGLDDWQVTNIGVYQKRSSLPQNSMSDALVPEIRYDQLEDVATRFLEEPPCRTSPRVCRSACPCRAPWPIREDRTYPGGCFDLRSDFLR